MKIVFLLNYYNHHKATQSQALYHLSNGKYTFIQTEKWKENGKIWGGGCMICRLLSNAVMKVGIPAKRACG